MSKGNGTKRIQPKITKRCCVGDGSFCFCCWEETPDARNDLVHQHRGSVRWGACFAKASLEIRLARLARFNDTEDLGSKIENADLPELVSRKCGHEHNARRQAPSINVPPTVRNELLSGRRRRRPADNTRDDFFTQVRSRN